VRTLDDDVDPAHRMLRVRAETTKNRLIADLEGRVCDFQASKSRRRILDGRGLAVARTCCAWQPATSTHSCGTRADQNRCIPCDSLHPMAHLDPDALAKVQANLQAGETALATLYVSADPGTQRPLVLKEQLLELANPFALLFGGYMQDLVRRVAFGRAVDGAEESLASGWFRRVDRMVDPVLVLTASRLLLVNLKMISMTPAEPDTPVLGVMSVPRAQVRGIRAAPKGLLRRGRVIVDFVDGSWCAILVPPASAAKTLVQQSSL
jgi:hypothetical protein